MSQLQKYAWFNLGVFGLAVVVYLALLPLAGPIGAFGAFGVCGLWGFGALILKKNRPGKIVWDERENSIWLKSGQIGFGLFWAVFVAACMIPWFVLGSKATISVDVLPNFVFLGMGIVWVAQAVAILLLSRQGGPNVGE